MATEAFWGSATALAGIFTVGPMIDYLFLRTAKTRASSNTAMPPIWIAFITMPIFLVCRGKLYWAQQNRFRKTKQAPVYPHRDPILGTDWIFDMAKALKAYRILEVWDGFIASIGHTFWYQSVGSWGLVTDDPENLKAMLSTNFEDWPIAGIREKSITLAVGPHTIFSINGKEWQKSRAMIRPTFVRNQIADLQCQDRHVERLLAKLPRDGSKVDLQELFYKFTMDSATDFMFGRSTDTLASPTEKALNFASSFDYALMTSVNRSRLGWISFLKPDKKFDNAVATCRKFMDEYIANAIADDKVKERPYVFLNELVASGASKDEMRDQLMGLIIGGRDTTASTMSALFWTLVRRPDVMGKLRDEVAMLGGQKPSWEELKNLKYLSMVLKETLRLWSPIISNMRMAARDTVLPRGGGHDGQSPVFVPKGTSCRWTLHSLHRRKDIFGEDAGDFRPERWETLRPSNWAYLPFHGGPRTCLGQQFALTQMSYTIVRILQERHTLCAEDDRLMLQQVGASTKLLNGCWVSFGSPSH